MKYQNIAQKLNEELNTSDSTSKTLSIFVELFDSLKKNNSLDLASEILKEAYELAKQDVQNIAFVETPIKLSSEQLSKLHKKLKKIFGDDVELKERLSTDLKGGIRIFYKDDLIDLSWDNQISLVAKMIKQND